MSAYEKGRSHTDTQETQILDLADQIDLINPSLRSSLQSWALEVFQKFFNNKNDFLHYL